jgi:GNAT superfamily N-acetyltransferase
MGTFLFKPVERKYRDLVHSWLKKPYIAEWFYGQGLENTIRHLDEFLEGAGDSAYWLAFDGERPFAFFITSKAGEQAITLDMLIGEEDYLGKGLAASLIEMFLSSQFPDAKEVLIDPEATNKRAVHVYEKAGFRFVKEFIPSHSPHLHYLMKLNR